MYVLAVFYISSIGTNLRSCAFYLKVSTYFFHKTYVDKPIVSHPMFSSVCMCG